MQNYSNTNPKDRLDSETQGTMIGSPDLSLSKSRLISEQENDPELAPLFKLVLPPVELKMLEMVCLCKSGGHQMSMHLKNGQ